MKADTLEIIKLNNLRLAARLVSEQLKQGVHLGKKVGYGSEFEQYRHYTAGDDPKLLDWKYFSKSGKYMVKESQTESHLHVTFMMDLSGSMNYEEKGIKRLDYAKNLLASLAFLAHRQSDSISYFTFQHGQVTQQVAPSPKAFQRLLYQLGKDRAEGNWPLNRENFSIPKSRQKELVIIVSDFLQQDSEWLDIVQQLRYPQKELILFQLLGDMEVNLDFKGSVRFKDLEGEQVISLEGTATQKSYNAAIRSYLDEMESALRLPKVHLLRASLQEPITELIHRFLARRSFN